ADSPHLSTPRQPLQWPVDLAYPVGWLPLFQPRGGLLQGFSTALAADRLQNSIHSASGAHAQAAAASRPLLPGDGQCSLFASSFSNSKWAKSSSLKLSLTIKNHEE